tara:strand:+ start:5289 stop:5468 length:180 start_codon:yes stop_codon:yes gene_type:complete
MEDPKKDKLFDVALKDKMIKAMKEMMIFSEIRQKELNMTKDEYFNKCLKDLANMEKDKE